MYKKVGKMHKSMSKTHYFQGFFHALFPDLFLEAQIRNESSSFAKMHLLDIKGDSQNGLFFLLQHLLQSIKSYQ